MSDKFEFIDVEYAAYQESDEEYVPSIVKMCVWMEVSRSGVYDWRDKPESAAAKRRGILALCVQNSFDDSDDTYGYRRVHADLVAWGVPAGPELVRSLMRELGLEPCQPRPWRVSLTEGDGQDHDIPDLVQRDFTAAAPGRPDAGRPGVIRGRRKGASLASSSEPGFGRRSGSGTSRRSPPVRFRGAAMCGFAACPRPATPSR